jgi:hypothetical protein
VSATGCGLLVFSATPRELFGVACDAEPRVDETASNPDENGVSEAASPDDAVGVRDRAGDEANYQERAADEWSWGENPDLLFYRGRTVAILRRYARLSVEVGRLPSLLGREFFRGRVSSYHIATFEDVVIFVHDVERSLEKLDEFAQKLIAKIVLQEYSQEETAALLGCWRRTVGRRYREALDRLSDIFLQGGLLKPLPEPKTEPQG